MFSRISRYRSLPDVVVPDARRRTSESKALRLLPDVRGTFQHTVADGDRLDHLAFRYYQQPRKWWRICDANPAFFFPMDLLGGSSVRTVRVPVSVPAGNATPWATLAGALAAHHGVEQFRFSDDVVVTPQPQTISGQQVTVNVESHELAVIVTYNDQLVDTVALAGLIAAAGFLVAAPEVVGRVGQRVTIPPDVAR